MRRQGFTLWEVIGLLAIVCLLAVVLYPMFERDGGPRSSCQSNIRLLTLGIKQYVQDFDEKLPVAALANGHNWCEGIAPYLKTDQAFQCPQEANRPVGGTQQSGYTDYWYNSNCSGQAEASFTYVSNTFLLGDGDGGNPHSTGSYAINHIPKAWMTAANSPARRHLGGFNFSFEDGHVKWLKMGSPIGKKPLASNVSFAIK